MKKRISILCISMMANLLNAQEVYNLKHCIEVGLQQNYDIRIIRNQQQISDMNLSIGNAGYLPQLDLNGGYSGTLYNVEQKLPNGTTNEYKNIDNQTWQAGIYLNWTLFDGLSILTNYQRLKVLQQEGELNTRLGIENFIADLSTEYYNNIYQNSRLKSLDYAVQLSKERLRIVQAQYEIGSASKLELQQAKVDFNADSSRLMKQTELLYVSLVNFNKLLALENVETNFRAADTSIILKQVFNKEDLWNKTLSDNTLILLSEKEHRMSELNLKSIESQYYPYLKLNAGYAYTQNLYGMGTIKKQKNLGPQYGLTLGMNLYNGHNTRRQQRIAKIETQNTLLKQNQLQLSLKAELANIWKTYTNSCNLIGLEKENLETAQDNYAIAMERYKLGNLSGLELREAQTSLLDAEERLIQSEYSAKLCELSLLQLSGQLIIKTLE